METAIIDCLRRLIDNGSLRNAAPPAGRSTNPTNTGDEQAFDGDGAFAFTTLIYASAVGPCMPLLIAEGPEWNVCAEMCSAFDQYS